MGLARDLERRLEQLVDGLAAQLFRGRVHPVELATRIVREADLAVFETPAGPGTPNLFKVTLGGQPEPVEAVAKAQRELEEAMESSAAERGWRLEGPVSIQIRFGGGPASNVTITTAVAPGEIRPWARLERSGPGDLDIAFNRSIIGRGTTSDLHIPDEEVSRQHALLWREAAGVWLADLGSSNGTRINENLIDDATDLIDGDRLSFGTAEFTLRVL